MRIYNPHHWFGILFQFHKSDTARKLAKLILIIAAYSFIIAWLEFHVLQVPEHSHQRNVYHLHTLLGFALSLLLVFRTNTAYDRWWEGRKLWGALVNNSRNLAIKMHALLPAEDHANRDFFAKTIPFFAVALKEHLRSEKTQYALDEVAHPELIILNDDRHSPNQVARLLTERVMNLHREGFISGEQLLFVREELMSFTDVSGACERIKNTPIPYSYSAFIKKFIFIYVMSLPFGYVFMLGYWVVPVVAIVFYVLGSLELIAEEIEDPFGMDANDLPLDKICSNIQKHVGELL